MSTKTTENNTSPRTARDRFRWACNCLPVDRPPVWLMRQAGRALPEYRALREKYAFEQLVKTPELAAELTLQPIRRFEFDAAILFSDILVVPDALGQPFSLCHRGGIRMKFAIRSKAEVEKLNPNRVEERLSYVADTLRIVRRTLGNKVALIGFAGSPWTLATYMVEGGSSKRFAHALALFRKNQKTYCALAEKLTAAVIAFLKMQAECGVDALQIFDSNAGLLAPNEFREASGRWIQQIISALQDRTGGTLRAKHRAAPLTSNQQQANPIYTIVFSRNTKHNWEELVNTGVNVLGIDSDFPLQSARAVLPQTIAIQGNLSSELLSTGTPDFVAAETRRLLAIMHGRPGYIFNLGNGVPPDARLENIAALVQTVQSYNSTQQNESCLQFDTSTI